MKFFLAGRGVSVIALSEAAFTALEDSVAFSLTATSRPY